ncbi:MAG: B12-binding domain-containing radical SAM protein [Acutalibacteraceae bacterium]
MKNIYLIQAGCLYGNTYYLPYAVGMLAAFALDDKRVSDSYCLKRIIYSLEDIDKAIDSMEEPSFAGFSNSIWNYSYNLVFAKKLKERYPDCFIEFGGHHVPPDTSLLENNSFIDILVHGKGEEAFRDILIALDTDGDFSAIPNISYRDADGTPVKTPEQAITISDYPSPYLNGIFDDIVANGEYPFSCVLETNRGCPFSCCYCDWGDLNSKVRLFELDKVFAELEWMSEHKMEFVYCVDANFGMFERDELIAQKLVELKETKGYPNRLQVSYAKNEPDRVFRINKLLTLHGIGKGATLSLQSLSPQVLKNIGRVNIDREEYSRQLSMYRNAGISTYTELILGLPGETLESFSHGLCELLELGQHSSVSAYYCELLPNAKMSSKEYMEKYKIKTVSTSLNQYHCNSMDDVLSGFSHIVVETSTMSAEDWITANFFSTCVQSFHHFGLTQCLAMYLRKERDIKYYDFYSELLGFIEQKSVFLKELFDKVHGILTGFVEGRCGLTYQDDVFGSITYPLEEAVFLVCLYNRDIFYGEIREFAEEYIKDSAFLDELLEYQKAVVLRPCENDFVKSFSYNFSDYFNKIWANSYIPLENTAVKYKFSTPYATDDCVSYAKEIIWYGRRNGRMLYSNYPNSVNRL